MSELIVTLLRFGYLLLLWVLVLAAIGVLRRDVFGTRVVRRDRRSNTAARPASGRAAVVGQPGPPARAAAVAAAPVAVAPPPSGAAATATLLVTDGPARGTTLALGQSAVLLGRSPSCTLVLDDDYSSSRHARIFPHEGGWWVEDLGSTNGTFVDGERIAEPRRLDPGTPVRVGQTVVELQR